MNVPVWLTYAVAAMVGIFGLYRLRIAFRSREEDDKARARRGLYGLPRRTHLLFGILYLILAVFLLAAGLGYIKSPFAADKEKPAADAPTSVEVIEAKEK